MNSRGLTGQSRRCAAGSLPQRGLPVRLGRRALRVHAHAAAPAAVAHLDGEQIVSEEVASGFCGTEGAHGCKGVSSHKPLETQGVCLTAVLPMACRPCACAPSARRRHSQRQALPHSHVWLPGAAGRQRAAGLYPATSANASQLSIAHISAGSSTCNGCPPVSRVPAPC